MCAPYTKSNHRQKGGRGADEMEAQRVERYREEEKNRQECRHRYSPSRINVAKTGSVMLLLVTRASGPPFPLRSIQRRKPVNRKAAM